MPFVSHLLILLFCKIGRPGLGPRRKGLVLQASNYRIDNEVIVMNGPNVEVIPVVNLQMLTKLASMREISSLDEAGEPGARCGPQIWPLSCVSVRQTQMPSVPALGFSRLADEN